MEKSINQPGTLAPDAESAPLIEDDDPDTIFRRALDQELEKICSFYQLKELEIYGEVGDVLKDEEAYQAETEGVDMIQLDGPAEHDPRQRRNSLFGRYSMGGKRRRTSTMSASTIEERDEDSDEDPNERSAMANSGSLKDRRKTYDVNAGQTFDDLRNSRELPLSRRKTIQAPDDVESTDQGMSTLFASGMSLKKRTIGIYVSLCELKSFSQLNKTGFTKVLKKYDKTLDRNLKQQYLKDAVAPAYPFRPATVQHIDENIERIEKVYADMITKGDVENARRELRLHLREHVVWERNTVWREMIGVERKAQAANLGIRQTLLGRNHNKSRLQGDEHYEMSTKELATPVGRLTCPTWLFSSTFIWLVAIFAVFVTLLMLPIMKRPEQQNCLAMLVFVSALWATEVSQKFPEAYQDLTRKRSYPFS